MTPLRRSRCFLVRMETYLLRHIIMQEYQEILQATSLLVYEFQQKTLILPCEDGEIVRGERCKTPLTFACI